MKGIKIFKEDGRITIVIDHPSKDIEQQIDEMFNKKVKDIVSLVAPMEQAPVIKDDNEVNEVEVRNNNFVIAKKLASNYQKQREIGLAEVIKIFEKGINKDFNEQAFIRFITKSSHDDLVDRYHYLLAKFK